MDNFEKSELVIAKILGLLAEKGLGHGDLRFEHLELGEEFKPFFDNAVDWLIDEGLIRARNIARLINGIGLVVAPTLTARGMAAMGRSISVGGETSTVGEAVKNTAKNSNFYTGLADMGGGFVGGLIKSLGSS